MAKFKINVSGHTSLGSIGDHQNITKKPDECLTDKLFEESKKELPVMSYLFETLKAAIAYQGIGAKTVVGYGKLNSHKLNIPC